MATSYPNGIDSFITPISGQSLSSPNHITDTVNVHDSIVALETNIGVTGSSVPTTIDYILKNAASVNPGHLHTDSSISGLVSVPKGGTGATGFVPYAVLIGGVSSTGQVQSVTSVGATGQVLTSNGPSAPPTFQPIPGRGFNCGQTSRNISTTGAFTIAHGLGIAPKLVVIKNIVSIAGSPFIGFGSSNGSNDSTTWALTTAGAGSHVGQTNGAIIHIEDGSSTTLINAHISSLDATNINLLFTNANGNSITDLIQWEAYA